MTVLLLLTAAVAAALCGWLATRRVRQYAIERSLLDVPNARSSHERPTPRGGGLAIVLITLVGIGVCGATGLLPASRAIGLIPAGLLVAAVGWLDDRKGLPARHRFIAHAIAACWLLVCVGGLPSLSLGPWVVRAPVVATVLAFLAIVWCINLYNFMDGIDGLAAGESVVVGLSAAVLAASQGDVGLAVVSVIVAGSSAGFLYWNWSPARIFMGDVGSGFLGFIFVALGVCSERSGHTPLVLWAVLLSVFIGDATITLFRRLLRGERVYEAHRRHAYQRAVQAGHSHAAVTSAALALSVVLATIAFVATKRPSLTGSLIAVAAVIIAAAYLKVEQLRPM